MLASQYQAPRDNQFGEGMFKLFARSNAMPAGNVTVMFASGSSVLFQKKEYWKVVPFELGNVDVFK